MDRFEAMRTLVCAVDSGTANTAEAVAGGALAGLGIARLLSYQLARHVREGRLVQVLPGFAQGPMPVHLVHIAPQPQPLKLRAFLDFAAPRLRQRLSEIEAVFS